MGGHSVGPVRRPVSEDGRNAVLGCTWPAVPNSTRILEQTGPGRPHLLELGSDHLVLGTSLALHSICGLSTLELGQGTRRGQQGEGRRPHLKHAFPPVSHVKCTTRGCLLYSWIRTSVTSVNFTSQRDARLCGYDSPRFPTPAALSHHQSTVRLQRAPHPGHLTGKEP